MDDANEPEPGSVLIVSGHSSDRHKYRRVLSQVCATVAQSLVILDLGMMIAVPTIVIGVLHNAKEGLSLDDNQSSWFGSIMLLFQPLGSVVSGCLQGSLGRKKSILLVNIPHLLAWYMLYSARSVETLYAASFLMGIGIGFLEAPTLAYIGEISEPKLRGMLATFANSNVVIGQLLEFVFGCFFTWRHAMLASCSIPLIGLAAVLLIPESPIWLLSKGRKNEAMVSLQWLRGWVSADEVSEEFSKLELYCQMSKNELRNDWEAKIKKRSGYSSVPALNSGNAIKSEPGFIDGVKDLFRPGILIPFRLVCLYFIFFHAASLTALRPYMIEVFSRLEVPFSPNVLTVVSATLQGAGALTCICLIRLVGKRPLSLVSLTGCTLSCLLLGVYTYATQWFSMPSIPLILFCLLYFFMNVGISPIPWLLVSEVFPTRGRGIAGGLCAAFFYTFAFIVSKTWLNLQSLVELQGCFILYGLLGSVGIIYLYICLPETEGKTLAEIEKSFMRTNRK